jgi:hypothetical protein
MDENRENADRGRITRSHNPPSPSPAHLTEASGQASSLLPQPPSLAAVLLPPAQPLEEVPDTDTRWRSDRAPKSLNSKSRSTQRLPSGSTALKPTIVKAAWFSPSMSTILYFQNCVHVLIIQSGKTLAAYKAGAANATANVAPTFAAQGGVQSEVTESATATATATGSTSSTAIASSAAMNLHQFGGSAVSALFASVVFGAVGLMVAF